MVRQRARFLVWWRRSGLGVRLWLFIIGAALLGVLVYLQRPTDESVYQGSYLQIYLLVNLLIVILFILAFLVGRNVIKLIFDRRRRILGSQLRQKLVAAFVGLTLVPTVILFSLASGLLTNAFGDLFGEQIEGAVDGSVEIARSHYTALEREAENNANAVAQELSRRFSEIKGGAESDKGIHKLLEKLRTERELFSVRITDRRGQSLGEASNVAGSLEPFAEPVLQQSALNSALTGRESVQFEENGANKFFRVYLPILGPGAAADSSRADYALIATSRIPPEVSHANQLITDFYREYEQLKLFRSQLRLGNLLTLLMITALLLFGASWLGFYLARELTIPIQRLAEGTQAVARGNYDVQIRAHANDELGFLVKSFNKMTLDLKNSRFEGERSRLFMQTILENLMVSVIGLDRQGVVSSINSSAVKLFGFPSADAVVGKSVYAIFKPEDLEKLQPILRALNDGGSESTNLVEQEISVQSQGRELKILLTAGKIKDSVDSRIGTVLLFDDITELSKAQHMAAWREVARRIAHEIKNPLTPIQLSAQRLEKITRGGAEHSNVRECVSTIVENVDSIKRLANEFSNFARMPTAELRRESLNSLIEDVLAPYAENYQQINFQFIADGKAPEIMMDREQVRRALINLIDNAANALLEGAVSGPEEPNRIVVRTEYVKARRVVLCEVIDNGPGVAASDKTRIFEPYFSTRRDGTGLGLAIVTSIVSDHQGVIRVFDNSPRGAKFQLEFPEEPRAGTQRKFATA